MIEIDDTGIEHFREMVRTGKKFDFSKWGDGELNAIFQDTKSRCNCDKHTYFPEMGERLLNILKTTPNYYIGLQSLGYDQREKQMEELTNEYNLKWCNANILHKASIKGYFKGLLEDLRERDVLLVGPEHLSPLAKKEGWDQIVIPSENCWLSYEEIKEEIEHRIDEELVILYTCSMMSGVLVDDFAGRATQIDMGSVLDPYAGVESRTYHKVLDI